MRARAPALGFVLAVHVLLVLMLIMAAPRPDDLFAPSAPLVVDLIAATPKADSSAAKAEKQQKKSSRAAPREVAREREKLPPETPAAPPEPELPPIELLQLTRAELASVGTTMGSRRAPSAAGPGSAGSELADGGGSGRGEGPGGAQLHDVDWYRKPTRAELTPYMPASAKQSGWGMVACKMVEGYRVELP